MDDQGELTRRYTEEALTFINQNSKKPFFLYLAHSMPHIPLGVTSDFNDKNEVDIQINPMHSTEVIVDSQL